MYTVYVLLSKSSGKQYIGQTQDLERRLREHEQGIARYTRNRGPWELIYQERLKNRAEAMMRERFLKSGQGREWLKGKLSGRAGLPQAD